MGKLPGSLREFLYPSDIADMVFSDRPTATVVIKNMEKQGWVTRELDPKDSRRIKVTLAPAGREKLKEIAQQQIHSKEEPFDPLSCFTREEEEQLKKLLIKLNQHLGQLKEDNSGRLYHKDFDYPF